MCKGILLYSAETDEVEKNFPRAELLWPAIEKLPENVPKRIASFYRKALLAKIRNNADDFAINIRKALEALCTDLESGQEPKKNKYKSLADRITELAKRERIPDFVQKMMQDVRAACNFGGHERAEDEDIDPVFCSVIEDFFYIVVAVVYVASIELKQFHVRVQAAKAKASQQYGT